MSSEAVQGTIASLSEVNKTLQPLLDHIANRSKDPSEPATKEDAQVLSALSLTLQTLVMIDARLGGAKIDKSHEVRLAMAKIREATEKLEVRRR